MYGFWTNSVISAKLLRNPEPQASSQPYWVRSHFDKVPWSFAHSFKVRSTASTPLLLTWWEARATGNTFVLPIGNRLPEFPKVAQLSGGTETALQCLFFPHALGAGVWWQVTLNHLRPETGRTLPLPPGPVHHGCLARLTKSTFLFLGPSARSSGAGWPCSCHSIRRR